MLCYCRPKSSQTIAQSHYCYLKGTLIIRTLTLKHKAFDSMFYRGKKRIDVINSEMYNVACPVTEKGQNAHVWKKTFKKKRFLSLTFTKH